MTMRKQRARCWGQWAEGGYAGGSGAWREDCTSTADGTLRQKGVLAMDIDIVPQSGKEMDSATAWCWGTKRLEDSECVF